MADDIRPTGAQRAREGTQRFTLLVAAVTALAALGSSVAAGYALVYTRESVEATRDQLGLVEQGQITERYGRAIDQLGSDSIGIRVGGIFALERIMRDSPADQPTIVEVLTAFVRQNATQRARPRVTRLNEAEKLTVPIDLQAALTVVGRRDASRDAGREINLRQANLSGADLSNANLAGAELEGADLTGARLFKATLADAHMIYADLSFAECNFADFSNAMMFASDLGGALVDDANLTGTDLMGADLTYAYFRGAKLINVNLDEANAEHADFEGADLTDTDVTIAHVDGANFTDAKR
jgi:hypothetical protein